MELYILDPQYEAVAVIDATDSTIWDKKYNDAGYCEIYIPCDTEMLDILQKGNYVYRYDDDMFCRIEAVEITTDTEKGDYIIATATDICNIFSGRIIEQQIVFSGTVAEYIRTILTVSSITPSNRNRAISNLIIDDSNFEIFADDILDITVVAEDLLKSIITACKSFQIGFRLSYDINTHKLIFKLYKGVNRATGNADDYVEFSPTYANIISSKYKTEDTNYKNVAYVGYKTVSEDFMMLTVYSEAAEPQGTSRKEIYVDGTSTSRSITLDDLLQLFPTVRRNPAIGGTSGYYYIIVDGETIQVATFEITGEGEAAEEKITVTDYTYMLLIRTLGYNALSVHGNTEYFSGNVDTIDTYAYKSDYDIGDIVKVENEYGISATARITEIMESDDKENGYEVEPKFEYQN